MPRDTPASATSSVIYELCASHPLASIDCTTSVKDVLLSPRWLARCNYALHKLRRVIAIMFPLSCVAGWICPFADAHTGRVMGLLVLLLQSGPSMVITLVHRYSIVCLLAGTYEFWYLTLINAAVTMLGCWKYSDLRACASALAFVGYENALLVDAAHRGTQNAAVLNVISGAVLMGYAFFMAVNLIDEVKEVVLFAHGNWYVEAGDVIVNGATTIIIMLLRNAYRQRQQRSRRERVQSNAVRCIAYRCRVRLAPVTSTPSTRAATNTIAIKASPGDGYSQLRLARPGQRFSSDNILSHSISSLLQHARSTPVAHATSRVIYNTLCSSAAVTSLIGIVHPDWMFLSITASVLCTIHFVVSVTVCQRRLLRKLLSSFDVAYISGQFTLMLLSISYLQNWDHRCLGVLDCWVWIHWVLLLDAITPITKRTLGIQDRIAIAVISLVIIAQVLIIVNLIFLQRWQLKDRILFTVHFNSHSLHFRAASFMLSRIFSIFWWCWRLLWRLVTRTENEMILIQEAVEYDDVKQRRGKPYTPAGIQQITPTTGSHALSERGFH